MNPDLGEALTNCPACHRDVPLVNATCPLCGAPPDTLSAFLSIRYPNGNGGMVDQKTASFLRSYGPEPRQADIQELFASTSVLKFSEMFEEGRRGVFKPVAMIDGAALRTAFDFGVFEIDSSSAHLMSFESHRMECWAGERIIATLGIVWPVVLRWPQRWKSDAHIKKPDALADFAAAHGYAKFRTLLDEMRIADAERARKHALWAQTWNATMPESLCEIINDLEHERYASTSPVREKALRLLNAQFPAVEERILNLLAWFGHSLGPWSGFPSSEVVPEYLLEACPRDVILRIAERDDLNVNEMEGIARFLCQSTAQLKSATRPKMTDAIRERVLTHVRSTGDEDKIRRATRASTE